MRRAQGSSLRNRMNRSISTISRTVKKDSRATVREYGGQSLGRTTNDSARAVARVTETPRTIRGSLSPKGPSWGRM